LFRPDGEAVAFVNAEEFTSDAKELLPAMKAPKINEAVNIALAPYIVCAPLFE
jgi:hypothetical protein